MLYILIDFFSCSFAGKFDVGNQGAVMNNLVFGAILLTGFAASVYGGYQLSQASSGPAFNYREATTEQRKEFLNKLAKNFEKPLRRGLINPSGVGANFTLTGYETDTSSRQVVYNIRVSGMFKKNSQFSQAKAAILKNACAGFIKSDWGKSDVTMVQKFLTDKGSPLASVRVSVAGCRSYL